MRKAIAALVVSTALFSLQPEAKAEIRAEIAIKCGITVACAPTLGTVGVVLHELIIAERPFGPTGEGMKLLNGIGNVFKGLFSGEGARRSPIGDQMRMKYGT